MKKESAAGNSMTFTPFCAKPKRIIGFWFPRTVTLASPDMYSGCEGFTKATGTIAAGEGDGFAADGTTPATGLRPCPDFSDCLRCPRCCATTKAETIINNKTTPIA